MKDTIKKAVMALAETNPELAAELVKETKVTEVQSGAHIRKLAKLVEGYSVRLKMAAQNIEKGDLETAGRQMEAALEDLGPTLVKVDKIRLAMRKKR